MARPAQQELFDISDEHTLIDLKFREAEEILLEVEGKFSKDQLDVLRSFAKFLKTRLLKHFREEEASFFKLLLKLPKESVPPNVSKEMVKQLIADHRLLDKMIAQFSVVLKKPSNVAKVTTYAKSVIEFTRVHARKENSIVRFLSDSLDDGKKARAIHAAYNEIHPHI